MRVLYFSNVYESSSFISSQVAEIADRAEVYYACCDVDKADVKMPHGVNLVRLTSHQNGFISRIKKRLELSDLYFNLHDRSFSKSIATVVKDVKPDIVHCQYGYDALFFLENHFDPAQKYVITFRGFDASLLLILDKYRQKLNDYLSRPNVHPVFVCHALMNNLLEKSIVLNRIRAVIYSNTDTQFYTRKSYDHKRSPIVFTQVSNFREKKGHQYTIQAFEKFKANNPTFDFVLNFVGEVDSVADKISKQLEDSPLHDRIIFTGKKNKEEIRELLEQSHVFIHNSITSQHNDQEGIPNAIMEAMAMELPVVATTHSGIPELKNTDEDVFLAEERNIDEYQECIARTMQTGYSKVNRQRIIDSFSKELFKQNILKFYDRVLGETDSAYRQCTHCVLDTQDDPDILFDSQGVCNYCHAYKLYELKYLKKGAQAASLFEQIVSEIKASGKDKPYDCILGLSGGVDSTYLAYIAKNAGLRPLAVHFDNGWNSELAVGNIENIITRLDIPLSTFVMDWEEFKDLQLSFLKASVVDIEVVTDHAIIAKLYDLAIQHDIKYVLSGTNIVTEAILPSHWIFNKKDHVHVKAIHKLFGKKPLKTFPLFNSYLKWKVSWKGIKSVPLLDYIPYRKNEVKEVIKTKLGWRDYGGKHYESVFTRFYQGYILPQKFGIDKRKAHLANLICSGQLTRDEALAELKTFAYDEAMRKQDYEFVLKKLNLSDIEFQDIMHRPVKRHTDYPVETVFYDRFPIFRIIGPLWRGIKRLKSKF